MPRRRRVLLSLALVVVAAVLIAGVAIAASLPRASTELAVPPRASLEIGEDAVGTWSVGAFEVRLDDAVTVTHPDAAVPVWETPRGEAFVSAGVGDATWIDDFGLVRVRDEIVKEWTTQRVDAVSSAADGTLEFAGVLSASFLPDVPWTLALSDDGGLLEVSVALGDGSGGEPAPDRLFLRSSLAPDEGVHGFGAQTAGFDLRGTRIPLIPREQGIGRGEQPISTLVDLAASAAGGHDTTYLVSGVGVTDLGRSIAYRGTAIASVDLTRTDHLVWEVWGSAAEFSIAAAPTPLAAVEAQTRWTGAATAPPAWAGEGLIAGIQGGTAEVREKVALLQEAGVPLAGVWLQDWVGRRTTDFGERLQWNWTLDTDQYPEWDELVEELEADGIRVLTYVNPSISADSAAASAARGARDLHAEAAALGYLALDAQGEVLEIDQHGFDAAMVDLSNPDAREWFAQVIADEVAGAGATGWMADFAEGPPPEAALAGGTGAELRPQWPVLWQDVNQRALELAGLQEEGFVFHRSGHTASAGAANALWAGDQLQSWSDEDGLGSLITISQQLAASGMAQAHGDIGGYTSIAVPLLGDVARDDELTVRWAEASVLQPVFRTHEGNRPDASAQPAEDPELAAQLASMTRLFAALGPERDRLARTGPLGAAQQHPWMLAPEATDLLGAAGRELQLGPDVLLAPVLTPGADEVEAVLPPGRWVHIWTGTVYGATDAVEAVVVPAPLGQPALFAREGTAVAAELTQYVVDEAAHR